MHGTTALPPPLVDCLQIHLADEGWPAHDAAGPLTLEWSWRSGEQTGTGRGTAETAPQARVTLLVLPASRVTIRAVQLPPGRAGRDPRVLANAIEEGLAVSPERIVATALGPANDGLTLVAAVDRDWLDEVLATLRSLGIEPGRISTETEALALDADATGRQWTVVRTPGGGFVHVTGFESLPLDLPDSARHPPLALRLLVAARRAAGHGPERIRILETRGTAPADAQAWSDELGVPVADQGAWQPAPPPARPLAGIDLAPPGAHPDRRLSRLPARWHLAIGALLFALGLQGAMTAIDTWRMQREFDQIQAGLATRFRAIFPEARVIVDPVLQMRRLHEARALGGAPLQPDDLLELLGRLAHPLAAAGTHLRSLGYAGGELVIGLEAPTGPTGSDPLEALNVEGVQVERDAPAGGKPGNAGLPTFRVRATR
jgi:type II secretion system protein L